MPVRFGNYTRPIRLIMANKGLRDPTAEFSPRAVVGLEDLTDKANTPEEALSYRLRRFTTELLSQTPGTMCGHPSATVTYAGRDEPHGLITVRVVCAKFGGRLYAAMAATMSTRPDDPTYVADQQAILDGFVVVYAGKD